MPSTGVISGTPTVAGTFTFTSKVADSKGKTDTATCTIVVVAPVNLDCGSCGTGKAYKGTSYSSSFCEPGKTSATSPMLQRPAKRPPRRVPSPSPNCVPNWASDVSACHTGSKLRPPPSGKSASWKPPSDEKILKKIETLGGNPRPTGVEKLTDTGVYRVRVGDYRIIYDIVDKVTTVLVLKVGDRKEVYKR
jgi:mRNA-degrading endonuclease RelE of RelBE toxin-antitoxin system